MVLWTLSKNRCHRGVLPYLECSKKGRVFKRNVVTKPQRICISLVSWESSPSEHFAVWCNQILILGQMELIIRPCINHNPLPPHKTRFSVSFLFVFFCFFLLFLYFKKFTYYKKKQFSKFQTFTLQFTPCILNKSDNSKFSVNIRT